MNDPAFLHDPELYEARFHGLMRAPLCRMDMTEDCELQGNDCTMEADVTCSSCYKTCCLNCSFQTGIADGYRCAECEQDSLDKLERACKLIGSVKYQEQLVDAMMKEIWV